MQNQNQPFPRFQSSQNPQMRYRPAFLQNQQPRLQNSQNLKWQTDKLICKINRHLELNLQINNSGIDLNLQI